MMSPGKDITGPLEVHKTEVIEGEGIAVILCH